jgi:hypothetical protein
MAKQLANLSRSGRLRELEGDEIDHVLSTLQELIATVDIPVVKLCLEEAHDDIAHLTSCESSPAEAQDTSAVA